MRWIAPLGAVTITVLIACRPHTTSANSNSKTSTASLAPLPVAEVQALRRASKIYWRHPGEKGPARCEEWRLRWIDDAQTEALLERDEAGTRATSLRLSLTLADGHLEARSPEVEHRGEVQSLPCILSARIDLRRGETQAFDLDSHERWFVDANACANDDRDRRIRPLGCPAVFADPASRARLTGPPAKPAETKTTPTWLTWRRIFLRLQDPDGDVRCLALRRRPGPQGDHHGRLEGHLDRWTMDLGYHFDGTWLTFSGPVWRRRRGGGSREQVQSRSCLLSERLLEAGPTGARFTRTAWFRGRSTCENAAPSKTSPLCLRELPTTTAGAPHTTTHETRSTGPHTNSPTK
ncbi:MAG TPA: hypothetical protein ENK31_00605 [Nannocystis exedens]|nr:hypothetical protein [Nannocystis exedens]